MYKDDFLIRQNLKAARRNASIELGKDKLASLIALTKEYGFSISLGDLLLLNGHWYATHAGLLRLAHRRRCSGIRTALQLDLSAAASERWVFKAVAYKKSGSRGFVGYGDADPSNVPSWLRGCELRIAETRAVNRALRKAYGIGLCSVEELGSTPGRAELASSNGNGNGSSNDKHNEPRLRDRLSLLIRQHRLEASLVNSYAAEFCGTQSLRDASRELAKDFINHLRDWAARDLDGLVCHLNRYSNSSQPEEVHS